MPRWNRSPSRPSPFSAALGHASPPSSAANSLNYRRSSSPSPGGAIDPESFTFATVSHEGLTLALPEHAVALTVPEGALEPGFTEEIFLAVMTEGRDRPRLSDNQTLVSPVVLAGPPRLALKKPAVLTFGHCASLQPGSAPSPSPWELGVYHCDSLFSAPAAAPDGAGQDETPWVKLATVGQGRRRPRRPVGVVYS